MEILNQKDDTELILINISGHDKPGVTSSLTAILGKYDAMIMDIGQADIHHTLSLGIMFKTTSSKSQEYVLPYAAPGMSEDVLFG